MIYIKKASREDAKLGWSFDYRQLREIQASIETSHGESLSLEQLNAVFSYLEENFTIHPVKVKEKE